MPLPPASENRPLIRLLDRWKARWGKYTPEERAEITRRGFDAIAGKPDGGTGVTGGIPGRWETFKNALPRRSR